MTSSKDELDILEREPNPQIRWTDIPVDPDKTYTIYIEGLNKFKTAKTSKYGEYAVFKVKLIDGFDDYEENFWFKFHIPKKAFIIEWDKFKDYRRILKIDKPFDCVITFKRTKRTNIVFVSKTYPDSDNGVQNGCDKY